MKERIYTKYKADDVPESNVIARYRASPYILLFLFKLLLAAIHSALHWLLHPRHHIRWGIKRADYSGDHVIKIFYNERV